MDLGLGLGLECLGLRVWASVRGLRVSLLPALVPPQSRYGLGTAPTQYQSILGVLLRAIYILNIIQLLLSGGSTQGMEYLA